MSKFSDKCKEYLAYSGMTVYELSKASGLERTALHRMITGQRLPSEDLLRHFCSFVCLTGKETQHLTELYYEEKIGTEKVHNRKYIRNIYENLAESELSERSSEPLREYVLQSSAQHNGFPDYTATAFQTKNLLLMVLKQVFSSNCKQTIYTNLPVALGDFIDTLCSMFYIYESEVHIYHFLTFLSNPTKHGAANYNLELLNKILYLALSPYQEYCPYYTYGKYTESDLDQLAYPYYLVTNELVLEVSGELSSAIVHRNPDHLSIYQKRVKQLRQSMQPLIVTADTAGQALSLYGHYINEMGIPTHILQSSPGIKWLLSDPEEIQRIIQNIPEHASLYSQIQQFIDLFYHCRYTAYFSKQGLDSFCQNGLLPGQIGIYFPPLSISQRILCLKSLLSAFEQDDCQIHMIDDTFHTPANIYTEIYGIRGILFAQLNPDKVHLKFCYINESNLCRSFFDFFQSMEENEIILSGQNAAEIIEKRIQILKSLQSKE